MTGDAIKNYPDALLAAKRLHEGCPMPFPLNVSRLLEAIGTHTVYDLSSQTYNDTYALHDGEMLHPQKAWTIYNEQLDVYLIVWNAAQSRAAIRYSVAHEIGHIVLNHERSWPADKALMKHKKEQEATAFAKYLLAPLEEIHILCGTKPYNAKLVAEFFGIPYLAAQQLRSDYTRWRHMERYE